MQYIVGIDFGHGETTAHIFDLQAAGLDTEQGVNQWLNGGQNNLVGNIQGLSIKRGITKIRSVMCAEQEAANREWKYTLGPDAQRFYTLTRIAAMNNNTEAPRFFAYFKHKIARYGHLSFNSDDEKSAYMYEEAAFGIFLKEVYKSIININDENSMTPLIEARGNRKSNFILYTACPSGWNMTNREDYCRFMNELGIPCKKVLREADAAWMTVMPNNIAGMQRPRILVIDYGSSTIDFTWSEDIRPDKQQSNHLGASRVEEDIFKYIKQHSESSRSSLQSTLNHIGDTIENRMILESLITYDIRDAKESFYSDLSQYPNSNTVCFRPINLSTIIFRGIGEFSLELTENNGFINNNFLHTRILANYISEVRRLMIDFKENHMQNGGKYQQPRQIILTGGASRMPFVAQIVQEVFGTAPLLDTLEASERISKGIVMAGVKDYLTQEEGLIEKLKHLKHRWSNLREMRSILYEVATKHMRENANSMLNNIFDSWEKGDIKQEEDSSIIDQFLLGIAMSKLESKIPEEKLNSSWDSDYFSVPDHIDLRTWHCIYLAIKDHDEFSPENISLDSLFSALFKRMSRFISDDSIASVVYDKLQDELGLRQLKDDIAKYIRIYFPDTSYETIEQLITLPMPQMKFGVTISDSIKSSFLVKIIEGVYATIEEIDGAEYFNNGITNFSLYKNRKLKYRMSYFTTIRPHLSEFCNEISPEINNFDIVCAEISSKVCAKIESIIEYCTQLNAN